MGHYKLQESHANAIRELQDMYTSKMQDLDTKLKDCITQNEVQESVDKKMSDDSIIEAIQCKLQLTSKRSIHEVSFSENEEMDSPSTSKKFITSAGQVKSTPAATATKVPKDPQDVPQELSLL